MKKKITKKRGSNVQGRKKRLQLLESSGKIFSRLGYNGTTVRDISDDAGVQPSALIYHFQTKENLFKETLRHHIMENAKLYHMFDNFNSIDASNPQVVSDAIFDCTVGIVHLLIGPVGKVNNLAGLLKCLLNDGGRDANRMVQNLGDECMQKVYDSIVKANPKLTETDVFWWTRMFWSLVTYPVYGELMMTAKLKQTKYPDEFIETLISRLSTALSLSIGLPKPTQMKDTWTYQK